MRWIVWLSLLAGCGSSSTVSDGGNQCSANGAACGGEEAGVGDFRGATCCSGFCVTTGAGNATACSAPNVDFSGACAPSPCGGDPSGTWTLVGGCAAAVDDAPCGDGGVGALGGGVLVVAGNSGSLPFRYDLHACQRFNEGSNDVSGSWSPDAGTVAGNPYCVQGNTLWIYPKPESSFSGDSNLTALKLTR